MVAEDNAGRRLRLEPHLAVDALARRDQATNRQLP
jgi:hypothetical protein